MNRHPARRCRLPALVLLVLAISPYDAWGQDSSRVTALRSLKPGQLLRIEGTPLGRVEGRLLGASGTTLTLSRDSTPTEIRLPDIERLWVRGRATGKGALIGAGVGIVAGAAYGLLIGSVACEPVDGGDCTSAQVAAVMGLIGGAGGAAVGAGVGYAIPVWRLRFP
jgi:hypothetical protein